MKYIELVQLITSINEHFCCQLDRQRILLDKILVFAVEQPRRHEFPFLQHAANSLPAAERLYASLTGGLGRCFKAHHSQENCSSKQPLFPQDFEHLIDTCGIDTPKQLQSKCWLNAFFLFTTTGECHFVSSIMVSFKFAI